MGKKVKKSRPPQKEKRVTSNSQKKVPQPSEQSAEKADGAVSVAKEKKHCPHLDKGIDLDKLSAKIGSSEPVRCEDCREGAADRRASKGKGKHGKKNGSASVDSKSESKPIWVCLECGHYACGGVGLPTNAQYHAVSHARQTRHPLVIQFEKPQLRWCFPCSTLVSAAKVEENGEHKDVFSDVVKLIKGHTSEGSRVNGDDVWYGTGSVATEIKSVAVSGDLDAQGSYTASGLVNLGNTCFFNSVLQNLLAMDKLRDYFLKLDAPVGPLTMALKKLFIETKPEAGLKNAINPRSFFGCICSKAPQFRGYQQHDSHELLRCLLDGLSSEELGMRKQISFSKENGHSSSPSPTFVDVVFGGQVSSTVCCVACGHSSTVYEPFLDLSLPVPTKKPTCKKAQQPSRAKKAKLPPKRGGKSRPRVNRGVDPVSVASTSRELSCQPMPGSAGPTTLAEENGSVAQNSPAVDENEKKQVFKDAAEQTSDLLDDSTWLDYLEPEVPLDGYDLTSNDAVAPTIQDSKNKDTFLNAESGQSGTESSAPVLLLSDEPDRKTQFPNVNPWEDELPLQVQSSEVLLLPYKEENSTAMEFGVGEASSSVLGGVQEDFDGFGGLFDEPEVSSGPIVGPSLGNEVVETGFMVGNSSESDPDEVDDSNSPVSVETCLAHYTKPELLTNENAWHCENCSKSLVRQKSEASKQLKTGSKALVNGETRIQCDLQCSNKDPCPTENRKNDDDIQNTTGLNNFGAKIDCSSQNHTGKENDQTDELTSLVIQREGGKVVMKDAVQDQADSSGSYYICRQESVSDQAINMCCVDEPSSAGSISNSVQQGDSESLTPNPEPEETGDDEINSKMVKVKRDATKRVLINKAPPILTIHLKRFSQDARGRLSKLNGHVTFREMIDLKPYMDARCIEEERYDYHLVGVVEHLGSMRGGHYIAYVRGGENSRGKAGKENEGSIWYHTSDAYVHETSLDEVLRCEAYILFYEKL
ncbi:Ubiquitinyl hydrolase [Parasponia andersonii]|uniref:Ubiquitin carboxyl-terminal hydrolase n=1 Tax=Parasponia andersonii TaxID=3476 RepID=A0A2P5A866_PARAD|nr:Ubiquitinyl hydrolase [Parasponia andersonii]